MAHPATTTVKVWDAVVRLSHWSLVAACIIAYVSSQIRAKELHIIVGYVIAALWVLRVLWGFAGTHYARFAQFLYSPAQTLAYVRSLRGAEPLHYRGHNPLGALMVFGLLLMLLLIVLSGLLVLAGIEFEGPLAFVALRFDDAFFYSAHTIHEVLVYVAAAMVVAHVGGVVIASRQHHENLVRSMITGRKPAVAAVDATK